MKTRIAIDSGGTFTDCVWIEGGRLRVKKVFSTPQDPSLAIRAGLQGAGLGAKAEIRHGTTVGTNSLLERSGARVAFVTTAGFEDTIAIGRQNRPHLYRWANPPAIELAPAELRFGIEERTLPDGTILRPATAGGLAELFRAVRAAAPEAVAVSLLFSFANPRNERAVARALEELGVPVSVSHQILPEFREYERGAAVLINAYLAPRMGAYLRRLQSSMEHDFKGARLHVMQSSGGIVSAPVAAREPVRTILSGPAGGVVGAHAVARRAGFARILSFDMGGTSTDVALVDGGAGRGASASGLRLTHETQVMGLPVSVPMLDIHTVGAGGGSLASFDGGGALQVGPASAGADPGPICYGRGERPTVTDANLALGRLDPEGFLGGGLRLDEERTRRVFERERRGLASIEAFADGIVRLAEARMEKALRRISVERGFDPREFTLVSFGGAGPLHACALAEGLEIPRVLVPQLPGALSALGILLCDMVKDFSRTVMLRADAAGTPAALRRHFAELETRGRREMRAEGLRAQARRSLDLRYAGQGFELTLDHGPRLAERFHKLHEQRYGYRDPARPLEIVSLRVRMLAPSPPVHFPRQPPRRGDGRQAIARRRRVWFGGAWRATPVYDRERLRAGERFAGPAVITEYSATTVVPPGWRARVDGWGNLILETGRTA